MDETWTLIFLSLCMLVGCYLAGSIPLAVSFSEEKLKLVTVLGAGLLVGTALAVIIPEGVHTMYASHQEQHDPHTHGQLTRKLKQAVADAVDHKDGDSLDNVHVEHGHQEESHGTELHVWIGVALVLGFIFMLIIDQLGGGHSHSHSTAGARKQNRQEDIEACLDDGESSDSDHSGTTIDSETGLHATQNRNKITATLGLVVHAAADGVALGAAASSAQPHVEMIVFIAIMLHKAPAAFGLVSFLMHEGFDRNRIRKHLAVFSAAAPLLAIITYFGLSQQNKEKLSDVNATGIAMLFSAGTFLYVATVHVLPELSNMGTTRTTAPDGTVVIREQKGFNKCELLLMVTGAILPLFLSLGHHH